MALFHVLLKFMYHQFCVPAEITDKAIVLLVVTADATPIPPPSGELETSDPLDVTVANVFDCGATCRLLTLKSVKLLPTVAVVLECACPIKYSPGVKVVTSGIRNICIPVKKFVHKLLPLVVLKDVVPPVLFVTQLKATLAELEDWLREPVIPKLAVVHWLMRLEFAAKSCRVKIVRP